METQKGYLLNACYLKQGFDKEKNERFNYMLISFTNFETQEVIRIKPLDTQKFIEDVWPKTEKLVGQMVKIDFEQKSYKGQLLSFVKDINLAK